MSIVPVKSLHDCAEITRVPLIVARTGLSCVAVYDHVPGSARVRAHVSVGEMQAVATTAVAVAAMDRRRRVIIAVND